MSQSWKDFDVVESLESIIEKHPIELPESGAGALLGWVAGPRHCVGIRKHPTGKFTQVAIENTETSVRTAWREPRSEDDWTLLDEAVNEYLREAGVPARPGRLWWYLVDADVAGEAELRSLIGSMGGSDEPIDVLRKLQQVAPVRLIKHIDR